VYRIAGEMHRVFGVLDLDYEHGDVRFSIGLRNANDKSVRLALTIGYKVAICDMFKGDFTPIFHKPTSRGSERSPKCRRR